MSMTFYAVDSIEPVAHFIRGAITQRLLEGQRVLWLVAGGSSVAVAIATAKLLEEAKVSLDGLTVSLTDERYGIHGHPDSNWQQMKMAGFDLPGARLHQVLGDKTFAETVADFDKFLENELTTADYRIGLFGIGEDGHTSGILPHSAAVHAQQLVCGYTGSDYQRITTTPAAIARLDETVVYAVGKAKHHVLEGLGTEVPLDDQPAQALKSVARCTVFNDRKGDKL